MGAHTITPRTLLLSAGERDHMLYLCDRLACARCNDRAGGACRHTTDPSHAIHGSGIFEVEETADGNVFYFEVG